MLSTTRASSPPNSYNPHNHGLRGFYSHGTSSRRTNLAHVLSDNRHAVAPAQVLSHGHQGDHCIGVLLHSPHLEQHRQACRRKQAGTVQTVRAGKHNTGWNGIASVSRGTATHRQPFHTALVVRNNLHAASTSTTTTTTQQAPTTLTAVSGHGNCAP